MPNTNVDVCTKEVRGQQRALATSRAPVRCLPGAGGSEGGGSRTREARPRAMYYSYPDQKGLSRPLLFV